MRSFFLIGGVALIFIESVAQAGEKIPRLLDSAKHYQFINFDRTIEFAEKAEQLIISAGVENNAGHFIQSLQLRITACRYFKHFQLCRQYLDRVDELTENFKVELGENYRTAVIFNLQSRAGYYYDIDDYEKSLAYFTQALQGLRQLPQTDWTCYMLFNVSQYIASIHGARGELEASINQYLTSVPYYECYIATAGPQSFSSLVFRNIGLAYLTKGDYDKAGAFLSQARDSLNTYFAKTKDYSIASHAIALHETLARYYTRINQHGKALATLRQAASFLPHAEPFTGRYYLALGEVYESSGNTRSSAEFYDRAARFFLNTGTKGIQLSDAWLARGRLQELTGDFAGARKYYQDAITSLVLDFDSQKNENPALSQVLSKKRLFTVLHRKSTLLEKMFKEEGDAMLLNLAYQTNQLALALFDSTANEFSLDRDKIILREQSFSAFEGSIRMAYELYRQTGDEQYLTDCFALADKSKGVLLLENLRLVNRFSGVQQEWLEKEKAYKSEMLLLEQSIYQAELNKKNIEELNAVRERYASVRNDYARLMESFKNESPQYYRLRFDRTVVTPEIVQQQLLKPGEVLVEFFVGDSSIMILGITPEKKFVTLKKFPHDFQSAVGSLQASYFTPNARSNDLQVVIETLRSGLMSAEGEISPGGLDSLSKYVYNYLLEDCLAALGPDIRSLIIVPDGVLGYLPFESLSLIKRMAVRYAPSSSYLLELSKKQTSKTKHFFAGFVAENGARNYAQLPGARKEVDAITALLKADFSIFDPADKKSFLEQASNFRVLHLAMHSVLNDHNPMMSEMVFSSLEGEDESETMLTAIELYNLKLHADLVVLSACETGIGQMHRGEGIMSFSRAFAYAGASSAVISLWKVPDKATSKLMVYFYQHLKKGLAKDEALRQAKLDFIRDYPQMTHPFYWAGFILTGSNDPLDFPEPIRWWWYVAGVLIVGVLFAAAKKALTVKHIS